MPRFWEIPQISSHLRNFQNLKHIPPLITVGISEFPKRLGIWEILQMPGYLGSVPNAYFNKKCKCCRVMLSTKDSGIRHDC